MGVPTANRGPGTTGPPTATTPRPAVVTIALKHVVMKRNFQRLPVEELELSITRASGSQPF